MTMKKDWNEVESPTIFDESDFFKKFPSNNGGRASEFYTPVFIKAVEMAIDNPDKFIRFYSYSSPDLLLVGRKGGACATFAKKYFKDNELDNFVVFQRKLGNKVQVFMVNATEPEKLYKKHNTRHQAPKDFVK